MELKPINEDFSGELCLMFGGREEVPLEFSPWTQECLVLPHSGKLNMRATVKEQSSLIF